MDSRALVCNLESAGTFGGPQPEQRGHQNTGLNMPFNSKGDFWPPKRRLLISCQKYFVKKQLDAVLGKQISTCL
jgi:hypothetical protein